MNMHVEDKPPFMRAAAIAREKMAGRSVVNALSVDVEDYFQVEAFKSVIDRTDWDCQPSRVVENTAHMLDLFEEGGVRATFFILGWVAERFPEIVRRIKE